jgi:hypothetical protein
MKKFSVNPAKAKVEYIPEYYPRITVNNVEISLGTSSESTWFIDHLVRNTIACAGETIPEEIAKPMLKAGLIELYSKRKTKNPRWKATKLLIDNHQKVIDALDRSSQLAEYD